ncbi:MAG: sulfotransferase [Roseivirga sp.]|nr:sulfotransferase [Roseivirga sp.]
MLVDMLKKSLTLGFKLLNKILGIRPEYIFVMGHMRSGSSLLSHLLLSNTQINGLGESNAIYQTPPELWRLALKSQLKARRLSKNSFYLDQINHNEKTPNYELLKNENIKVILLIRNPQETVASIMKLAEEYYEPWTQQRAEKYLTDRYKGLITIARLLPEERVIWVEYEKLTEQSDSTLDSLSNFLSLKSKLKAQYDTFGFTGKHGDPSDKLRSGKVGARSPGKNTIEVSEQCSKVYARCQALATA